MHCWDVWGGGVKKGFFYPPPATLHKIVNFYPFELKKILVKILQICSSNFENFGLQKFLSKIIQVWKSKNPWKINFLKFQFSNLDSSKFMWNRQTKTQILKIPKIRYFFHTLTTGSFSGGCTVSLNFKNKGRTFCFIFLCFPWRMIQILRSETWKARWSGHIPRV